MHIIALILFMVNSVLASFIDIWYLNKHLGLLPHVGSMVSMTVDNLRDNTQGGKVHIALVS